MKRFVQSLLSLFVAAMIFSTDKAWAWGQEGHQIVGQIADWHLCANAQQEVKTLLNGRGLADVASWADQVKNSPQYRQTKPWHYANVPLGGNYTDADKPNEGDLVQALNDLLPKLRSGAQTGRAETLKFIVHFVGDAHQPFHAGQAEDRGGNDVKVNWFGRPENLHWVWDTGLIVSMGKTIGDVAKLADSNVTPPLVVEQKSPEEWIDESAALVPDAYPGRGNKIQSNANLDQEYQNQFAPIVMQRLRQGGYRLANIVNQAFGCNAK